MIEVIYTIIMSNYILGATIFVSFNLSYFLIKLMKFVGTLDDNKIEEIVLKKLNLNH